MSNRLDDYLRQLEKNLRGLPRSERDAELREIRSHLEALVEQQRESGAPDPTAAALEQFGEAKSVGRELRRARSGRESVWRVGAAVMCGLTVSFSGLAALPMVSTTPDWMFAFGALVPFLTGGLLAGCIAPGRAVWTVGIAVPVSWTAMLGWLWWVFSQYAPASFASMLQELEKGFQGANLVWMFSQVLGQMMLAITVGAWLGGKWTRKRKAKAC